MGDWWNNLSRLNQAFYAAAAFFSVFFLWQLLAALIGLGGDEADADDVGDVGDAGDAGEVGEDAPYHDFEHGAETDAAETTATFRLLSIRSIITFFTLFSWGGALYLNRDEPVSTAMVYAMIWGVAGMLSVALAFYGLKKLTQTGTPNLDTCIGEHGNVYLDIPEGGRGEVRVMVSGAITHVKARSSDGKALKAGTPVRVLRRLDPTTVEIERIQEMEP